MQQLLAGEKVSSQLDDPWLQAAALHGLENDASALKLFREQPAMRDKLAAWIAARGSAESIDAARDAALKSGELQVLAALAATLQGATKLL